MFAPLQSRSSGKGHHNRIVCRKYAAPLEVGLILLGRSGLDQDDVHEAGNHRLVQVESITFHLDAELVDEELNNVLVLLNPLDQQDLQVGDLRSLTD